ncbi:MAG: DUF4401 domain-containing protein [Desulfobulbaceae bacterium]|nr:DUF4401 domain-containing protein [Desulfobulbaceae bacterium]
MNNKTITIKELLAHPQVLEHINKSEIEQIHYECQRETIQTNDPLYIKILSGVGAWFSAFFLIMFCVLADLLDNSTNATVIGIIFFIAAIFIAKASKATFLDQLALALAIAGNILLVFYHLGIFYNFSFLTPVLIQTTVCLVVYPLYANAVYRYLAPILLALLIAVWIVEEQPAHFIHFLIAAETLLLSLLTINKKIPAKFNPLLYSAATMLPATLLFLNFSQISWWRIEFQTPIQVSSVLVTAFTIYLFIHLAGGAKHLREPWLITAIGTSALLGAFTTPGIPTAIALLVLGYNYNDRILSGLAYLFLPIFLILYYYSLNVDLAYKSWILAGSGLILLTVRLLAKRFLQPKKDTI